MGRQVLNKNHLSSLLPHQRIYQIYGSIWIFELDIWKASGFWFDLDILIGYSLAVGPIVLCDSPDICPRPLSGVKIETS